MPRTPLETLTVERLASPAGGVLLVSDRSGAVRALDFEGFEDRMLRLLGRHWGPVDLREGRAPGVLRSALEAYFEGDLCALEALPVRTNGTAFQRAVWTALRTIPPGQTLSYGQLAAAVGAPRAVRAVGLANGRNPVALIVPCHRVIGAGGRLTGYAGGLDRKRWLLTHEGALSGYPEAA